MTITRNDPLGIPSPVYKDLKANVEAIVNPGPAMLAFATDTGEYGYYDDIGTMWIWIPAGGTGDVSGPSSSVDGDVALFNGVTGKIIKDSSAIHVDAGSSGATGGTITDVIFEGATWRLHTFTADGTFTPPVGGINVEMLIVGGGGRGGFGGTAGGGGGGGVIHVASYDVVAPVSVTVGDAGTTGDGGDSIVDVYTAVGGGKGADVAEGAAANSGGSGGGASSAYRTPGNGTLAQGNGGGSVAVGTAGGGGGGATEAGGAAAEHVGGNGGDGYYFDKTGSYYGGGGGAASYPGGTAGTGGLGGGGDGGNPGTDAAPNTGGGGGGGGFYIWGDGATGVVIFAYLYSGQIILSAPSYVKENMTFEAGNGIAQVDFVDFLTSATSADKVGRVRWNNVDKCLEYDSAIGTNIVTNQLGQEVWVRVRNNTAAQIDNGKAVYIAGALGNRPTIALAKADAVATCLTFIGLATEDIPINADGFVTVMGSVRHLNTNAFTAGDILYVSPTTAGEVTATRPVAPNQVVAVGVVTVKSGGSGEIAVQPRIIPGIERLSGVYISGLAGGDLLQYNSTTLRWENKTVPAATGSESFANHFLLMGG